MNHGEDEYPSNERVVSTLSAVSARFQLVPAMATADELGSARVHNVVLVGALSQFLAKVPMDVWLEAIRQRVPERYVAVNERAFSAGVQMIQTLF